MLYIRPQAFKCHPGLRGSTCNLCKVHMHPPPFFEVKLLGTNDVCCHFSFLLALLNSPVQCNMSPCRHSNWSQSNLAQIQLGHYRYSKARRWENETTEVWECQLERVTSRKPCVIWVLQSNHFEIFTVINGVQFERKIKSKYLFMAWDFDMKWSLSFQAANHIHKELNTVTCLLSICHKLIFAATKNNCYTYMIASYF